MDHGMARKAYGFHYTTWDPINEAGEMGVSSPAGSHKHEVILHYVTRFMWR